VDCADVLVHASVPGNTFAIYGHGEEKEITELVPGILNQLGADSLATLRQLAESIQGHVGEGVTGIGEKPEEEDDDDVPDLVENADEAEQD
jgi:nascent polypeptide-associated complex subunit beta